MTPNTVVVNYLISTISIANFADKTPGEFLTSSKNYIGILINLLKRSLLSLYVRFSAQIDKKYN